MDNVFDNKDIQKFLLDYNILWNGKVIKESDWGESKEIIADVLFPHCMSTKEVILDVSQTGFVVSERKFETCYEDTEVYISELVNLSFGWLDYLINKSPENANIIKAYAQDKLSRINKALDYKVRELESQIAQIKREDNKEISVWQGVVNNANRAIDNNSKKQIEPENE